MTQSLVPDEGSKERQDFEQRDISITILLHQHDGDEQGRLVSVLIHNFSDPPVAKNFREAELSKHASLDLLQHAIAHVMQLYQLHQIRHTRHVQEEEAKREARAATPKAPSSAVPPASTPTQAPTSAPPVTPQPSPPPAVNQQPTTSAPQTAEPKKKDSNKPAPKYQQYSML